MREPSTSWSTYCLLSLVVFFFIKTNQNLNSVGSMIVLVNYAFAMCMIYASQYFSKSSIAPRN